MTVSLDQAKAQLRVRHNDDDQFITDLVERAEAAIERYVGADVTTAADLDAAKVLLVEFWFYPDSKVDVDTDTGFPRAVVSLARPFRTPTLR